ncbi:hypothetical protein HYV87_00270 [Candidatus Woesearchaeota archaeon]|nr:hypothetical protein [Candidatus Woesearchaeota archaeon]
MSNILQVRKLYPKSILFSVFILALALAAKLLKKEKKEENISEFRYVMD